ncbi:MFS transporter [Streptomyces piniterrae]|uniref:MFS transporter n=1 Tax=Streptomyces piniterrae TaxID=2571125 RepID=A0A4U0NWJ2_9ACTN|nr:MFS transporter [Streptomyces piniterrae]TJZ59010.1 MFS transporter [Streptomyces piniterrae]
MLSSTPPKQLHPPSPSPPRRNSRLFFTLFYTLSSFAEGGQNAVLLWLTYALTSNAFLIGVMVVLSYLPAAVAGLLFKRFADRGRANVVARSTNLTLSLVSLLLAIQHFSTGDNIPLSITVIAASQIVLSFAKMFNKAALNRLVRGAFGKEDAKRLLAASQSASLIGQVIGTGLAGMALAQGWITAGLLCAALSYAASAGSLALGTKGYPGGAAASSGGAAEAPSPATRKPQAIRWNRGLVTVLLFSVPSSGALPFLSTLLVPLAKSVSPGQPSYYALLNIVTSAGGFLAGIVLSTGLVGSRRVLRWALPVATVLAPALGLLDLAYGVAVIAFLLSLVATCHVITMQVLTNQVPQDHEVGQFAIVRNVVASLAKAGFALAAGTLAGLYGITVPYAVLAASTALFTVVWLVMRPERHIATALDD